MGLLETSRKSRASTAPAAFDARDGASSTRDGTNAGKSRRVIWTFFVLLFLVLLYGGYRTADYLLGGRYAQETNDAYIRADMFTVSSKLGGYIRDVAVRDNQMVARGTLLATIDSADFANRVADADAQLAIAAANQDAVSASVAVARTGIVQANAALTVARRDVAYFGEQVRRYRSLMSTGAEPRQAYDQYAANLDKAVADVAGKSAAVQAAHSQLRAAEAQLKQAMAQRQSAELRKDSSKSDLDLSRIVAPISGRVVMAGLRRGQFVQPGRRLLSIVPTQEIYVEANFKETQIGLMMPGQPVKVGVDALPGIRFKGYVESLTPGTGSNFSLIPPQNATGNFVKIVQRVPVRIYIVAGPEARRILVPGLSANVEVDTASGRDMQAAIEKEQGETSIR